MGGQGATWGGMTKVTKVTSWPCEFAQRPYQTNLGLGNDSFPSALLPIKTSRGVKSEACGIAQLVFWGLLLYFHTYLRQWVGSLAFQLRIIYSAT